MDQIWATPPNKLHARTFLAKEFRSRNPGHESSPSESETEQMAGKAFLVMKEIPDGITTETTEV
jgi:hypothetical protein